MKKFFLFAAAVVAAMTVNADPVVKNITEYANYIEFQALMADPDIKGATMSSEKSLTLPNGTVLLGAKKGDGSEGDCKWNAKDDYNTTWLVVDGLEGVDSLVVGTQWRAFAGCTMTFGAFQTIEAGKVSVYYQLNGDDSSKELAKTRGVGLSIMGGEIVEYRFSTAKNCCVASFDLPAGSYDAGDVVLTVLTNTVNIAGVRIEKLASQGVEDVNAAVKAQKIFENGQLVIIKNGVRYNALGAQL